MKWVKRSMQKKQPGSPSAAASAASPTRQQKTPSAEQRDGSPDADLLLQQLLVAGDHRAVRAALSKTEIVENEQVLSQLASRTLAHCCDGGDQAGIRSQTIKSVQALVVLLQLLPLLPDEIAGFYLSSLLELVQPSAMNAQLATTARVVQQLLEWLTRLVVAEEEAEQQQQLGGRDESLLRTRDAAGQAVGGDGEVNAEVDQEERENRLALVSALLAVVEAVGTHLLQPGEAGGAPRVG
jgi:hypothetical protein